MTSKSAYSLRKICREDLPTVLAWRNSDRIRSLSYNDREISPEEHQKWFEELPGVCLIFEANGMPAGVVQFFDFSSKDQKCKWGFYLGDENPPRGLGSVMGSLAIAYAFENLRVDKICGEAISHNDSSIRFHQKLGFIQDGRIEKQVYRNDHWLDVILFSLSRSDWAKRSQGSDAA